MTRTGMALGVWLVIVGFVASADAKPAFEKAAVLYRPLHGAGELLGRIVGHVGLYVNSHSQYDTPQGQLALILNSDGLDAILEAPGPGEVVHIVSFAGFNSQNDFMDARELPGLTAAIRNDIILAGLDVRRSGYRLFGAIEGPDKFRCDGLVAYCYRQAGRPIPESWGIRYPMKQRNALVSVKMSPPTCGPVTVTAVLGGFRVSVPAGDGLNGSGIDRVEFSTADNRGMPAQPLGVDDHDVLVDGTYYFPLLTDPPLGVDPGRVAARVVDQAGNATICRSDGTHIAEGIPENPGVVATDDVPPQVTVIALAPEPPAANQAFVITWTPTDNVTPAGQIFSAALVDVPFEQWTDATATFSLGTSLNVPGLAAGPHRVYVVVADANGNLGSATRAFLVGACVERADTLLAQAQLPQVFLSTLFSENLGTFGSKAALEAAGWTVTETGSFTPPPTDTWKTVTTITHSDGAPTETIITGETKKTSFGQLEFGTLLVLHGYSDGLESRVKMTRTIPASPGGRAFLTVQGGAGRGGWGPPGGAQQIIRVGGPG